MGRKNHKMKTHLQIILIMGLTFMFNNSSSSQQGPKSDRSMAAAGRFYPASADTLKAQLAALFRQAKPRTTVNIQAVISPHAG